MGDSSSAPGNFTNAASTEGVSHAEQHALTLILQKLDEEKHERAKLEQELRMMRSSMLLLTSVVSSTSKGSLRNASQSRVRQALLVPAMNRQRAGTIKMGQHSQQNSARQRAVTARQLEKHHQHLSQNDARTGTRLMPPPGQNHTPGRLPKVMDSAEEMGQPDDVKQFVATPDMACLPTSLRRQPVPPAHPPPEHVIQKFLRQFENPEVEPKRIPVISTGLKNRLCSESVADTSGQTTQPATQAAISNHLPRDASVKTMVSGSTAVLGARTAAAQAARMRQIQTHQHRETKLGTIRTEGTLTPLGSRPLQFARGAKLPPGPTRVRLHNLHRQSPPASMQSTVRSHGANGDTIV